MLFERFKNIFNRNRDYSGKEIDYETMKILLKNDPNCVLLDVRSKQEYKENHLDSSINISLYDIQKNINNKIKDKEKNIIVYCQTGGRSKRAINILKKLGYKNLYNLKGGLDNISIKD